MSKNLRDSELKTTLNDYIDLLNKYNSNFEYYNSKIRLLQEDNKFYSNRFSILTVICLILGVAVIVLLCYGYGQC